MRAGCLGVALSFLFSTALPACAEQETPQLWSILWRIEQADLVCAGTVEAHRPTTTFSYESGRRYRDMVADIRIDTVFSGQHEHEFLSITWKGLAPETGGFIGSGPPRAEYRVGKRYLLFLRRHLPSVFVPLDPFYQTEVELAPASSTFSRESGEDSSSHRAIALELSEAVRRLPDGSTAIYLIGWITELLGEDARELLEEFLAHSRPDVRVDAAEQLNELNLSVPADVLLAILVDPNSPYWARGRAAELLGKLRVNEARPHLLQIAHSPVERQLRQQALFALREVGAESVVPELISLLDDPDPEVRIATLAALLSVATGKLWSLDIIRMHEVELIRALRSWAGGGAAPDMERLAQ